MTENTSVFTTEEKGAKTLKYCCDKCGCATFLLENKDDKCHWCDGIYREKTS